MFGLSAKQLSTLSIFVFLFFTRGLSQLFPNMFPSGEMLTYQVWTFAIWLFVMFLPRNVGSAFL